VLGPVLGFLGLGLSGLITGDGTISEGDIILGGSIHYCPRHSFRKGREGAGVALRLPAAAGYPANSSRKKWRKRAGGSLPNRPLGAVS